MQYKVIDTATGKTIMDAIPTLNDACRIAANLELRTGIENKIETDFERSNK